MLVYTENIVEQTTIAVVKTVREIGLKVTEKQYM